MKNLIALIAAILISFFAANAQYTITDNDVTVVNGTITGCLTDADDWGTGEIIIPGILQGQEIKIIGLNAFSTKGITKLTLEEGVEEIKEWAFSSNPLVGVTFPNSLVKIKSSAFEHCSLTKIDFPDDVEYIGTSAFGYNAVDSVFIPGSVTFLGKSIFQHNSIQYVEFEDNSRIRLIDEKCFYDGGHQVLSPMILPVNSNPDFMGYKDLQGNLYYAGDTITDFTGIYYADLPPHVLTSEDVVWNNNQIADYSGSYTRIIIPSEINGIPVHTIPEASFDYKMLVEVNIEEGITMIDNNAFADSHIEKLMLPNTLLEVRSGAFMNNSIDTLLMPENLSSVGGSAFLNNTLKYVRFSEKLSIIEAGVFENNSLDSINIPENIVSISDNAFRSNSLMKLKIPETVTSIGKSAFAENLLHQVFMANTLSSAGDFAFADNNIDTVLLSEKLTKISNGLFRNNTIDTIVIPENIQSIGYSAFSGNSIRNIYIPNRVRYVGKKAFAGNTELTGIELPDPVIKEGYTFNHWQNNSDSGLVTSISDFDISYEALFTINTYQVTFRSDDHGSLDGDSVQMVEYFGEATEIRAIANPGYHFVEWQNESTGDYVTHWNPVTLRNIVSDTTLIAIFEKDLTGSFMEENSNSVSVFPNPAVDFLEITSPFGITSVEIVHMNGMRLYYNDKVNHITRLKIDLENYTSGIYFVIVKGENIYKVSKFVVQ